jgi:putative ABC transport system ATP-binding protein
MLRCTALSKRYRTPGGEVAALHEVSLTIAAGEFAVLRGPSGSGKTTLLLALGGMLRPTTGEVWLADKNLYQTGPAERSRLRRRDVGFVFQMFHLVPYLSAIENVLLGTAETGAATRARAVESLEQLGLGNRLTHLPAELSAGERQRTALARALVNRPRLVLADEPTGNLDPENARAVLDRLAEYRRTGGTVLLATHGAEADTHATRRFELRQGKLAGGSGLAGEFGGGGGV